MVTYKSIDKEARTATFDVDGESVTRKIPQKFVGTIDDYLTALAKGLQIEANKKAKTAQVIDTPQLRINDVVVPNRE